MLKIESDNQSGEHHRKCGVPSQDAVFSIKKGRFAVIALADGAGSLCNSKSGAVSAVCYACKYLMKQRYRLLYGRFEPEKIRYQMFRSLYRHLTWTAKQHGAPLFTFGSTLLCVLTNGEKFFAMHLGDGAILCELADGTYHVLSFPDGYENATYLTTGFYNYEHLRLRAGRCDNFRSFLLVSDGLLHNLFMPYYQRQYAGNLGEQAKQAMQQQPHDDDASYIVCRKVF